MALCHDDLIVWVSNEIYQFITCPLWYKHLVIYKYSISVTGRCHVKCCFTPSIIEKISVLIKPIFQVARSSCTFHWPLWTMNITRYVYGTPKSEVTSVIIWFIHPHLHGHISQYHGHECMTHILFISCQSTVPFLRYSYFRLWPWNSKVKVMGVVKRQGYTVGPVSY